MGKSLKQQLALKWRTLRCCDSGAPAVAPSILPPQFLPVLCVGSTSCKGYIIALHQLSSPALRRIFTDAAAAANSDGKASPTVTISCEPHTFEATFCLLQRSFKGLIHIPLSNNASAC